MRTVIFTMGELPPTLNEIIGMARKSKFGSAAMKKKWHGKICEVAAFLPKMKGEVYLECVWRVKNSARDQDNITAAQKYILDAMIAAGVIKDDNLTVIKSPVLHHFIKSGSDGFTLYLRDKKAFQKRFKEDLTLPPKSHNPTKIFHRANLK